MSKVNQFREFVNERLAAAALEIFRMYEKTLPECQDETSGGAQLQMVDMAIQPETTLNQTDVQQLSQTEPPQIKEEQELWTGEGGEEIWSENPDYILTAPTVEIHCDLWDSSQLPLLGQTLTVESSERDSVPTNATEEQMKAESDGEDYGPLEPVSDNVQASPVTPNCSTAPSLEEEERGGHCLRPRSRGVKSPGKSSRIQAKCSPPLPSPCPSPETCLRPAGSPSPWTRPIPTGSESEAASSGEAESKNVEKPYQCEECDKSFRYQSSYIKHRRVHTGEKPYNCEHCDKSFSYRSSFVKHKRVHTAVKSYRCEECDKYFRYQSSYIKHRRVHTGERPYQCEECERAFSQKGHLVKHRRRIHTGEKRIHTAENQYQCAECEQLFSFWGSLIEHMKVHAESESTKIYQCEECNKTFTCQSTYINHIRVHTREKPYTCEDCDKAYSQKAHLMRHKRIHSTPQYDEYHN